MERERRGERERRQRYNLDENHEIASNGTCMIVMECGFNCIIRRTLFSPC